MKKIFSIFSILFLTNTYGQSTCDELFFSEYIEGYSQNKALEIYNPTTNAIDLSNYTIERYSNGSTNSSDGGITQLSGTILPGDVFVITNGETDTSNQFGYCDPILYGMGDFAEPNGSYPTPLHMNGNDAIVLLKNGNIIDVIGKVGEDPGVSWTDNVASGFVSGTSQTGFNPGTWYTANQTLIRKSNVKNGDADGLDLFNPSLEWDTLPPNDWTNLGSHNCDCYLTSIQENKNIPIKIYPNPASNFVHINSIKNIKEIKIINLLGKVELTTYKKSISIVGIKKGTYLIKIIHMDETISNQILIIN